MRCLSLLALGASLFAGSLLTASAAEPCSSESKMFHGGANELFQKCHCEAARPPQGG